MHKFEAIAKVAIAGLGAIFFTTMTVAAAAGSADAYSARTIAASTVQNPVTANV